MVLHAGERHRGEHRFERLRCPDCDRVLLPHGDRIVCPACGGVYTSITQATRMMVEGLRPPPPPAGGRQAAPGRLSHRARDGQQTIFGGEVVDHTAADACVICGLAWNRHDRVRRQSCRQATEQPRGG